MPSSYPTSLDSLSTSSTDSTTSATTHPALHNDANDAINKIEAELGVDPSGASSSVRARLDELFVKEVRLATGNLTGSPTAANVAGTYSNGTAGVGATKAVGGTSLTIDGTAVANGDRVLLKDQTSAFENGIYTVSGVGSSVVLTRATDADTSAKIGQMEAMVEAGTANGDTKWICTAGTPTVGTDAIPFRRTIPFYGHGNPRYPWDVGGDTTPVVMATMPRALISSTVLSLGTAAQNLCVGGIVIAAGRPFSNVNFVYSTAPGTITTFWVAVARASDRNVLAVSPNSTTAWAAAPAVKTVALTGAPITLNYDTPVYVCLATQVATTAASIMAAPAGAGSNTGRAPILVGASTAPTSTPPTVGATLGALSATATVPYVFLT